MDDSGNYNNVLVVEPSLMPGSPEEKQAPVRPLDKKDLGEVHDTVWEVSAGADGQKATAAETRDGLKPLVPFRSIVIWLISRLTVLISCSHPSMRPSLPNPPSIPTSMKLQRQRSQLRMTQSPRLNLAQTNHLLSLPTSV